MLTLLRSKRLLTAAEFAERFDVSVRTVYRDMRKLEEAGVPIVTIEGRGYSLMEGYGISPVQFTEQEANALITAELLVHKTHDSSFIRDFDEAMIKIKSVFRSSIQEKSELLSSKIHSFEWRWEDYSSNALSEIQIAITHFRYLEIKYQKANDPAVSFRRVEPYTLLSSNQKWILIAWCELRNSFRSFRIDRIQHFQILPDVFEDRGFNLQTYIRQNPLPTSTLEL